MNNYKNKLALLKNNNKVFNSIIDELLNTSLKINKEDYERLAEELELIYEGSNSKSIFRCIELAKYCKENNELFFFTSPCSSLYLFYLLGITRFNPIEIGCRFETCLGTRYKTKEIYIECRVRSAFLEAFKEKVVDVFSDDMAPFYEIIDGPHSNPPYPIHISFLPKNINPDFYFKLEKKENGENHIVEWLTSRSDVPDTVFTVVPTSILDDCYLFYKNKERLDLKEALRIMNEELLNGNYEVVGGFDEKEHLPVKENMTLNEMISLFSITHNSYKEYDSKKVFFADRDSVFNYFYLDIGLKKIRAYNLMEKVRKGMFSPSSIRDLDLPCEVKEDLENIYYLWSRGCAADFLYFYLIKCLMMRRSK